MNDWKNNESTAECIDWRIRDSNMKREEKPFKILTTRNFTCFLSWYDSKPVASVVYTTHVINFLYGTNYCRKRLS